jgi:hypothetical protein
MQQVDIKRILWLLMLVFFGAESKLNAQQTYKYEHESGIAAQKVPAKAIAQIPADFYEKAKKHWYKEWSLEGISYELKTRVGKTNYSIEFDSSGVFQDIEQKVKFSELPAALQEKINAKLKELYKRYKIQKTELQWTAEHASLEKVLLQKDSQPNHYELIIKAFKAGKHAQFELLFAADGILIKEREIIEQINSDNLDF